MKKNYRLTIDFEIDINEKVKVPGDITDNGECTPEILEKTQHIMDAFFKEPRVMDEFIKNRLYSHIHYNHWTREVMAELLGLKTEEEFLPLLAPHLPPGSVPYLLGVFCGDKNFPVPYEAVPYDEDATLNDMVLDQFGDFKLASGSIKEREKEINSILPVNNSCLGNCILARELRDFLLKEVKYAKA